MFKKIYHCEVCGISSEEKDVHNRIGLGCLCDKHYTQYIKYGKFMDKNPRCVKDPNEIRLYNNHAEIDTYDQYGNVVCTFKLDVDDVPKLGDRKWRAVIKGSRPYLFTGNQWYEKIYFHRLVLPTNLQVDHISGDSTDNRKSNLRAIPGKDNQKNILKSKRNTSGIRGVSFGKEDNTWRVDFNVDKLRIYTKHFYNIEEAVYARYLLETKCWKDLRNTSNDNEYFKHINKLSEETKTKLNNYIEERINIAKARV